MLSWGGRGPFRPKFDVSMNLGALVWFIVFAEDILLNRRAGSDAKLRDVGFELDDRDSMEENCPETTEDGGCGVGTRLCNEGVGRGGGGGNWAPIELIGDLIAEPNNELPMPAMAPFMIFWPLSDAEVLLPMPNALDKSVGGFMSMRFIFTKDETCFQTMFVAIFFVLDHESIAGSK